MKPPRPSFAGRLLLTFLLAIAPACAQNANFNLSTNQTFSTSEQPKIHLYTRNVDALEFRLYRVNDPLKFMTNLRDMHSFGTEEGLLPPEQIDERTPIEKFHDWKAALWDSIREFFRHQFSHSARARISATAESSVKLRSRKSRCSIARSSSHAGVNLRRPLSSLTATRCPSRNSRPDSTCSKPPTAT
jgi:hypothetical protein